MYGNPGFLHAFNNVRKREKVLGSRMKYSWVRMHRNRVAFPPLGRIIGGHGKTGTQRRMGGAGGKEVTQSREVNGSPTQPMMSSWSSLWVNLTSPT